MSLIRLQINQQMARIGIQSQRTGLSIESERRKMKVERQDAKMSVETESPHVELEMQDFFDCIGLKSTQAFSQDNVAQAYIQAKEGTEQIVADGDFIGTLPSSGNRIGQLAKQRMLEQNAPEMCSGEIPYGAIKMNGMPGKTNISWSDCDVKIVWDECQSPKIKIEPKASVDIQLVQRPYIEIKALEEKLSL